MGHISYSDAIAILQIVYYSPAFLLSLFVCFRHGFAKSFGWYFLVTFCLSRLIGASGQLDTIAHPHSSTAWTIALVCSVFGTSPLLLSTLGLLSRIYDSITNAWSAFIQTFVVRIVGTVALVALILAIVGATSVSNPTQIQSNTEVHVAIILFLVVYIVIVAMALFAVCCTKQIPNEERVLLKAVVLALPFIFVKILYSLLTAFSGLSVFNFITGSKTADLCMAVLEEMVVVLLYLFAGLRVQTAPVYGGVPLSSPPSHGRQRNEPNEGRRGFNDGVRNFTSGRRGILMGAINAAANAADKNSRRDQGRDGSY